MLEGTAEGRRATAVPDYAVELGGPANVPPEEDTVGRLYGSWQRGRRNVLEGTAEGRQILEKEGRLAGGAEGMQPAGIQPAARVTQDAVNKPLLDLMKGTQLQPTPMTPRDETASTPNERTFTIDAFNAGQSMQDPAYANIGEEREMSAGRNKYDELFENITSRIGSLSGSIIPSKTGDAFDTFHENYATIRQIKDLENIANMIKPLTGAATGAAVQVAQAGARARELHPSQIRENLSKSKYYDVLAEGAVPKPELMEQKEVADTYAERGKFAKELLLNDPSISIPEALEKAKEIMPMREKSRREITFGKDKKKGFEITLIDGTKMLVDEDGNPLVQQLKKGVPQKRS